MNDGAPRLPIDEGQADPSGLSPGSDASEPPASGDPNAAPLPDAVPESPGEPGQLLLLDDFDDGDDAGWVADVSDGDDVVGSWAVVEAPDGWVYAQLDDSFDDDSWTVGGDLSWSDVVLEARFRFTSVRDMEDAVVMLATRFQTKDRYYYVQYRGDGTVKIRKRVDGSEPEMSSDDLDRLAVIGEWMTLRFSAVGNVLSAAVDGVVVGQGIIDDDLGFGGIALGVKENAAVELDDVRVTLP
jgi:hypothetical protein